MLYILFNSFVVVVVVGENSVPSSNLRMYSYLLQNYCIRTKLLYVAMAISYNYDKIEIVNNNVPLNSKCKQLKNNNI